ncbi:hypothetical protein [Streptomyces djakartensis]|uniref:hypothetical protein n=1 Tax=Streptomyces djakartensis TaxID=68193 RepID=UPI00167D0594|nr:hypothetical protein [Streptomyces djakartensis]
MRKGHDSCRPEPVRVGASKSTTPTEIRIANRATARRPWRSRYPQATVERSTPNQQAGTERVAP